MIKFEAVKFDPSPGTVVELLSEACAAANKRCRTRLLEDDPAKWRKGVNQYMGSTEGFEFWRAGRGGAPATHIMLSWWTDPLGRKHCVVRGRRVEFDGEKYFLDRSSMDRRPALYHCYPARIFFRDDGKTRGWVAVCGCGAAGTPESLGWMGDMCGPCHDAKTEQGEAAVESHRIGVLSGPRASPRRVAISPNGRMICVSDDSGKFHLWTLNDDTRHEFKAEIAFFENNLYAVKSFGTNLGFTGNSRGLINDYFILNEQIVGMEIDDDTPKLIPLTAPQHAPEVIIPWKENLFCRVWADELEWVDVTTRETVRSLKVPLGNVWQAIPSHDFSRLFIRVGNRCTVIDPEDGQILFRPQFTDNNGVFFREDYQTAVAFSSDFRLMAMTIHEFVEIVDGVSGRSVKRIFDRCDPFIRHSNPSMPTFVSFDSTNQYLICAGRMSDVRVFSTKTFQPLAAFAWHPGSVTDFSGTPDGKHFVSSGLDGQVKYWPIDRLIQTITTS